MQMADNIVPKHLLRRWFETVCLDRFVFDFLETIYVDWHMFLEVKIVRKYQI